MVEHTEYGILIHEARSKNILWANPAACRMFGFTLSELRPPLKAHHMSAQEQAYRRAIGVSWLQDAVNHGVSRRRWKYRSKDGKNFLTHAVATRVDFADGPVVMVEFRSIDQEVEREAELSRASDYLMRIMDYASAGGILLLDDEERIVDTGGARAPRNCSGVRGTNSSAAASTRSPRCGIARPPWSRRSPAAPPARCASR